MIRGHFHKRARRVSRALLAVVTSVVLVSALLVAGNAYAWCPHMQRASAGCCDRPTDREQAQQERAPEVAAPCCETRVVSELPNVDRPAQGAILAPAVAVLGAPILLDEPEPAFVVHLAQRARVEAPIRAGPQTALQRCVLLQTLLH